jgi:hypothetical protein
MRRHFSVTPTVAFALLVSLSLAAAARAADKPLAKTVTGDPAPKSIDVLSFGPQGILLIGDGRGGNIFAVQTADTQPDAKGNALTKIENIDAKLAARIGTTAKNVEVLDLAVNPASGKAYLALRKQDDKTYLILTVDQAGKIDEFQLKHVTYARLPLPAEVDATANRITDVAWAGDRVIAAARANDTFASKIFFAKTPLSHDEAGAVASAETYHFSHGRWETKAPMSVLIPYQEDGKMYIVGAFSCTPVVKYPVEALEPGAKVKGISMIELGSGNRPLDMFMYEKDGKASVMTNTFRFFHAKKPFGPSPYWTARFDRDLLADKDHVNEKAIHRIDNNYKSITDRIEQVEPFNGVVQMDLLDSKHALVLRETDKGMDLEAVALP